jgi:predicted thioesterase
MNVSHIKPSGMGAQITATAVLTAVEGRKLTFNVGARDEDGVIGEGTHVRFVVDSARFMSKVNSK